MKQTRPSTPPTPTRAKATARSSVTRAAADPSAQVATRSASVAGLALDTPWTLIVYRVPTDSSRARVAVWRDLKRVGGLYLQQCVCVLPKTPAIESSIADVRERIAGFGGTSQVFDISMDDPQRERLVADIRVLAERDYAEIIEECETRFVKEIEFERFRENYTFEEVEEIRHDLEKLHRWFRRATARDFFGAPGRAETQAWIERCSALLDAFEDDVYARTSGDDARET